MSVDPPARSHMSVHGRLDAFRMILFPLQDQDPDPGSVLKKQTPDHNKRPSEKMLLVKIQGLKHEEEAPGSNVNQTR